LCASLVHVGWARFCAHADSPKSTSTPSGVARQLVTFSCFAKEKVTKKKATPVHRPCGVPCVARLVRLPHKLARSATRPRAQTYSSEFPDQFPLLGGAQGKEKHKPKTTGWALCAHPGPCCESYFFSNTRVSRLMSQLYFSFFSLSLDKSHKNVPLLFSLMLFPSN